MVGMGGLEALVLPLVVASPCKPSVAEAELEAVPVVVVRAVAVEELATLVLMHQALRLATAATLIYRVLRMEIV
jgi:hypothetical protein